MKAGEFYFKSGYPKQDKFDRKVPHFDYYDMIDFAEEYYQSKAKELLERAAERAEIDIVRNGEYDPKALNNFYPVVDKKSITETPLE